MGSTVDVLIRGAGPAGTVAATWLARAGYTVALVHRQTRSTLDRIESLGPDIVGLLQKIGLDRNWLRQFAAPIPGTVSRWAGPWEDTRDHIMSPYGPAWSTRRNIFDSALLENARVREFVRVVDRDVSSATTFDAVGSDSSPEGEVNDKLVALTCTYGYCPGGDRRLRIEAVSDGWWYALRTGDALGVGFLTDRQTLRNYKPQELWDAASVRPILDLIGNANGAGPLRRVPVRCSIATTKPNRIGNARAAYDPLTGRGVTEAVRNALEAVSLRGQERQAALLRTDQRYTSYLRERQRLYELGARRFGTGFWTRRLLAKTSGRF